MADVAKAGIVSYCSNQPSPDRFPSYTAGEDIQPGDCCYINPSDGLVYRTVAASGAATDRCRGQAAGYAPSGYSVTVTQGMRFNYGANLTPGADYYLSATAGAIATTAAYAGAPAVGHAADAQRVQFFFPR